MTIDPFRLARAVHLDVERMSGGRWLVSGGSQPHLVQDDSCDCWDARAGRCCKHRLRLDVLAPEVLAALRVVVSVPSNARTSKP